MSWKHKKAPQKISYLSRISVVSEIFPYCLITAQQPKWQNSYKTGIRIIPILSKPLITKFHTVLWSLYVCTFDDDSFFVEFFKEQLFGFQGIYRLWYPSEIKTILFSTLTFNNLYNYQFTLKKQKKTFLKKEFFNFLVIKWFHNTVRPGQLRALTRQPTDWPAGKNRPAAAAQTDHAL